MKILNCVFLLSVLVFSVGCPRLAYVKIYNNTGMLIEVSNETKSHKLTNGESYRLRLGYEVTVTSNEGTWTYDRNVPHNGHDGPFFDGTLRVQIEPDGKVYALPVDKSASQNLDSAQPEGYPLTPLEKEGDTKNPSRLDSLQDAPDSR